jgi:DNA-binding MarR family transcriptional regulator
MSITIKRSRLRSGPAFLLAQIGAHAAARFAERLAPLGLTPPDAGILRILSSEPEMTQRALANRLGIFPSRLVLLLDDLARRGLVERHARPNDRRSHALRLTPKGVAQLEAIARVAREHQADLCAGLSEADRTRLQGLLERIAARQKLRPGVHPGYRRMGPR